MTGCICCNCRFENFKLKDTSFKLFITIVNYKPIKYNFSQIFQRLLRSARECTRWGFLPVTKIQLSRNRINYFQFYIWPYQDWYYISLPKISLISIRVILFYRRWKLPVDQKEKNRKSTWMDNILLK